MILEVPGTLWFYEIRLFQPLLGSHELQPRNSEPCGVLISVLAERGEQQHSTRVQSSLLLVAWCIMVLQSGFVWWVGQCRG